MQDGAALPAFIERKAVRDLVGHTTLDHLSEGAPEIKIHHFLKGILYENEPI